MTDDIELEFKRFSADKQEQIRQLVSFATLMGLTGKDLISIGGKLDRINQNRERAHRLSIVRGYNPQRIGKDPTLNLRFKMEVNGVLYYFNNEYGTFRILNSITKKTKTHHTQSYESWGRLRDWRQVERYNFLWDLHTNLVTLP